MEEYINKKEIYEKVVELEKLARERFIDTPYDSPVKERYRAQMDARAELKRMILDTPAVYAAPIRQGYWIWKPGRSYADCSECGGSGAHHVKYCSHCGAKMVGVKEP